MISGSVRKRASKVVPEEIFTSPSFEKGRRSIPEAELEHVSPEIRLGKEIQTVPGTTISPDKRTFVMEKLQHIQQYSDQVENLISRIDAEREQIRRIFEE